MVIIKKLNLKDLFILFFKNCKNNYFKKNS